MLYAVDQDRAGDDFVRPSFEVADRIALEVEASTLAMLTLELANIVEASGQLVREAALVE